MRWYELVNTKNLPDILPICPYCCVGRPVVLIVWSGTHVKPYTNNVKSLFTTGVSTVEELLIECPACDLSLAEVTTDDLPMFVVFEDTVREDLRRRFDESIEDYAIRAANSAMGEDLPLDSDEYQKFRELFPKGNPSMVAERFQEDFE